MCDPVSVAYSERAALLLVIRTVFGFAGFSCHSVFVPPAGDVLKQQQSQRTGCDSSGF